MFKPLTRTDIGQIIDLLVADLNKRLADREIGIELTEAAKEHIIQGGYEPMYGARPMKRYLQKKCRDNGRKAYAGRKCRKR